jgi:hypothetical protein
MNYECGTSVNDDLVPDKIAVCCNEIDSWSCDSSRNNNKTKELQIMSLAKQRFIQASISTSLVLLLLHHPKLYLYTWERPMKAFCRMPSPNARKMLCMNREIRKPVAELVKRLFVGSVYVDGRELYYSVDSFFAFFSFWSAFSLCF